MSQHYCVMSCMLLDNYVEFMYNKLSARASRIVMNRLFTSTWYTVKSFIFVCPLFLRVWRLLH